MSEYVEVLSQWWENAEVGDPKDGDVIIEWAGDGHAVRTFHEDERDNLYAACTYRILARAPKPKPAWHDAPAVIATYRDERGMVSGAWVREGKPGYWEGPEGDVVASEALEDVVPLIEAKVTDEMVERGWAWASRHEIYGSGSVRILLEEALTPPPARPAIFEARDLPGKTGPAPTETIVAAVLPIIAAEVRKAQADALREAKGRVYASAWWADGGDNLADRVRGFLSQCATDIEQENWP